jgi:hypothetical protein
VGGNFNGTYHSNRKNGESIPRELTSTIESGYGSVDNQPMKMAGFNGPRNLITLLVIVA